MVRGEWDRAEDLATQARAALRPNGAEESYAAPLVFAVQARTAIHRGDIPAARKLLVSAQRARPLLADAIPHVAVQARIELTRVHLALADPAGATTLIREIDEVLRRRPDLGTLVGETQALRARLPERHSPTIREASSLTAAELRVLPMLATHLSFPRSALRCSCLRTPSRPRPCRSTGSWAPPRATRPSPDAGSWAL
jgi:LuxR family maltose regulon positive regulatory protein